MRATAGFPWAPAEEGTRESSLIRDMWDLADVTSEGVRCDPERNCSVLAVVDGRDIARGDGRPWEVRPESAALVLEGFLVPVIQAPATVNRQLVASGPKAFLGPRYRALMRNP